MSGDDTVGPAGGNDVNRRIETTLQIHGPAAPEDVAALVAVLSALGGGDPVPAPPTRVWGSAARQVGGGVRPAPGAWSRSALPG